MSIQYSNFAKTQLASSITDIATSISVTAGTGALFPLPVTVDDYFMAVIVNTSAQREIVRCTARTVDTLTVVRAQEGTSALSFTAGDLIAHRLTAASIPASAAEATANAVSQSLALIVAL